MAKAKFDFESVRTKNHYSEQIRQVMIIIVVNLKLVLLTFTEKHGARTTEGLNVSVVLFGEHGVQDMKYRTLVSHPGNRAFDVITFCSDINRP